MAVNRVDCVGVGTLIDISNDTVTADSLLDGRTAHTKDGTSITGTVKVQKFRTGSKAPDNSIGDDGDLYLVIKE